MQPELLELGGVEAARPHPGIRLPAGKNHFQQIATLRAADALGPLSPTAAHAMQRNCETPGSSFEADAAWSVIQVLAYGMDRLFAAAQVLISLVNPVGARRVEDIEIDRVQQGFSFVRHVRRNGQDLARIHHDLLAVNPEL